MTGAGSVLFLTLSNLGDAVMTTPALEMLHGARPGATFHLVAHPRSSAVFRHCPYLSELIEREPGGLGGQLRLLRRLRARRFDLVVDLRTDLWAWLVRARRRLTKRDARPMGPHAVQSHAGVLAPLGLAGPPPPVRLWTAPEHHAEAARLLAGLPGRRWLALGPSCNVPIKVWPAAGYRTLVRTVRAEWDGVLILGGPGDAGAADALARDLDLPAVNLAGRASLHVSAAALARCAAFVGSDSGLGHVAAAQGVPTLTLFGIGRPERYRPWGPAAEWLLAPGRDLTRLEPAEVAARLRAHRSLAA